MQPGRGAESTLGEAECTESSFVSMWGGQFKVGSHPIITGDFVLVACMKIADMPALFGRNAEGIKNSALGGLPHGCMSSLGCSSVTSEL